MEYKWIGAVLIIFGCGGFGFSLAANHKREENALRQLIGALDYMQCELQYRMTPLPDLCRSAGQEARGIVAKVLLRLSQELESQISPDVASCMVAAMRDVEFIPPHTRENLNLLGNSLGRFDMNGQLNGLESVRANCRRHLSDLSENRDSRLRSYHTLGLCAGAALAILLI